MNNLLLTRIEAFINRMLSYDQDSLAELEALSDKVIALEFINTAFRIYVFPSASGIKLQDYHDGKPNVRIRATLPDMVAYLVSSRDDKQSSTGTLEVTGEVGLAQRFQSVMKNTDLDWEEILSRYTGDLVAHRIGNLVRGVGKFAKQTGNTLQQDVSEYLLYEKEILPVQDDIEDYVSSIDKLRNDVERLKLRIERLQRSMTSGT